jgi:hypothetical protein
VIVRLVVVAIAAGVLASTASAAPRPDAHDRALMAQLEGKVVQYENFGSNSTGDIEALMRKCGFAKGDPSHELSVVFALLPISVIVQELHDPFTDIEQMLSTMRPHSALFRSWVVAERNEVAFLLRFDNGGKKIDECKAARVLLSKQPRPAQIKAALGVEPALVAQLILRSTTGAGSGLQRLNPPMRAFLLAGGVSQKHAEALTS